MDSIPFNFTTIKEIYVASYWNYRICHELLLNCLYALDDLSETIAHLFINIVHPELDLVGIHLLGLIGIDKYPAKVWS